MPWRRTIGSAIILGIMVGLVLAIFLRPRDPEPTRVDLLRVKEAPAIGTEDAENLWKIPPNAAIEATFAPVQSVDGFVDLEIDLSTNYDLTELSYRVYTERGIVGSGKLKGSALSLSFQHITSPRSIRVVLQRVDSGKYDIVLKIKDISILVPAK